MDLQPVMKTPQRGNCALVELRVLVNTKSVSTRSTAPWGASCSRSQVELPEPQLCDF